MLLNSANGFVRIDALEFRRSGTPGCLPTLTGNDTEGLPCAKHVLTAPEKGWYRKDSLRHTSATLSLSSGDNVKVVAERLGHSSAKMTLDVYAHAVPTLQRESAERMDALLIPHDGHAVDTREVTGA